MKKYRLIIQRKKTNYDNMKIFFAEKDVDEEFDVEINEQLLPGYECIIDNVIEVDFPSGFPIGYFLSKEN